ncbi:hypothetical protein PRK78_000062 [Emydomyces testavorans]|uniref:Uncharacterized protein n=1 Tax=Emydomyces testavorans TaxID=2070801 RepID=A0AAF0IF74_9EURO|nr:hypothetical protein PRK78_000062 [Emydomyces testavorans]
MAYAHSKKLLTPNALECQDLGDERIAMITDFVPGNSLDELWLQMNENPLKHNSKLKQSFCYIGCVNHQPMRNFCEGIETKVMGPFDSEMIFDEWCLSSFAGEEYQRGTSLARSIRQNVREGWCKLCPSHSWRSLRQEHSCGGRVKITANVDSNLEYSGVYPDCVEYALPADIVMKEQNGGNARLMEVLAPFQTLFDCQRLRELKWSHISFRLPWSNIVRDDSPANELVTLADNKRRLAVAQQESFPKMEIFQRRQLNVQD